MTPTNDTPDVLDADETRLAWAVRAAESVAGDFAVLTAAARSVSDCLRLHKEAERLSQLLACQADAARLKAGTL